MGSILFYQEKFRLLRIFLSYNSIFQDAKTSAIFEFLKKTLWCYLSTILIATVICLILIYVMRWVATAVVWFSIFLMIAVFSIGKLEKQTYGTECNSKIISSCNFGFCHVFSKRINGTQGRCKCCTWQWHFLHNNSDCQRCSSLVLSR